MTDRTVSEITALVREARRLVEHPEADRADFLRLRWSSRCARFLDTEEVTRSNRVPPTHEEPPQPVRLRGLVRHSCGAGLVGSG